MENARILIVEDEAIVAEDLEFTIINIGYEVVGRAASANEAVNIALEQKPDLILMDIVLNGKRTGIDASSQIRKTLDIPIIFLSAYSDVELIHEAKSTQPYAYIVKPFQERQLLASIEMALYKSRMEKKIKDSEEWLSTTLKSIGDAVIATQRSGKIKFMNPVAETLTGWKKEEATGKPLGEIFNIVDEQTGEQIIDPVKNVLDEGIVVNGRDHTQLITKNGTRLPIHDRSAPIRDSNGEIMGLVLVFEDITERKTQEDEIKKLNEELELRVKERTAQLKEKTKELEKANQSLQELDRLKSLFIASTSHELRTPLNSIIGFTGILLEGWSGELNPEQKEQLEVVYSSGKHLLSLISDIIDISKIEAGELEIYIEKFELRSVVDEAIVVVKKDIEDKGLVLIVDIENIIMSTNRRRLLQSIINLLSNAVKFTLEGTITLTAKCINNNIDISIKDTGIGINETDIPKLFIPFGRLELPPETNIAGTGLGLYLTKKLVTDVLGGTVEVKSKLNKGSVFTLNIPVNQEVLT